MARLPQIGPTRARGSLGRYDVNAPVRQASIEGAANIRRAQGDQYAINSAIGSVKNAYGTHIQLRLNDMNLQLQKNMSDWEERHAGKESYTAEELERSGIEFEATEEVVDEFGETVTINRTQIPSYEVFPQLYNKQGKAIIESQSKRMSNTKIRSQWHTDKSSILSSKHAAVLEKSANSIKSHQEKRAAQNINEALEATKYTLAREIASTISDPDIQQAYRNKINIQEETDDYEGALMSEDINLLKGAEAHLMSEDYHDKGVGHLDERDRRIWLDAIRNRIGQVSNRTDQIDKVQFALLKDEGRTLVTQLHRGANFNPKYTSNLVNRLSQYADKPEVAVLLRDLEVNRHLRHTANDLFKVPHHIRNTGIQEAAKAMSADPYMSKVMWDLKDMSDKAEETRQTDPWQYSIDTGLINAREIPELDMQDLAGSIANRVPMAERIRRTTGSVNGFLTDKESQFIVDTVDSQPPDQKIQTLGQLVKGAGDRYPSVIQQLQDSGLKGSYAAAAIASAEGDSGAASMIYKGERRLQDKNEKWLTKNANFELDDKIMEYFNLSYPISEEHRSLMTHAFKAAYVGQLSYENRVDEGIDDDLAATAFDLATGGLVEHEGSIVVPPKRGFGQAKWEMYLDGDTSFHPTELSRMNDGATPVNYSNEELSKLIKTGEASLNATGLFSTNEYYIVHQGRPVLSSDGTPFYFKYLEDYKSVKSYKLDKKAQQIGSGQEPIKKGAFEVKPILKRLNRMLRNVPQAAPES